MSEKDQVSSLINSLLQQRDELKLQVHLASMDARDEFNQLSDKVDELQEQIKPLTTVAEDTAEGVFTALGMAADEVRTGFDKLIDLIPGSEE